MTHLRLVPSEPSLFDAPPAAAPAPAMPRAYAPPPAPTRLPTSAFSAHAQRLAPSRLYPDRVPAPPSGRAHVTLDWDDLELEQAVLAAEERLARGRVLLDGLGRPVDQYETQRYAGLAAAGFAGMQARIRPHLRADHPWVEHAKSLVERLAVEEAHWWGVEGRRR